MLEETPCVQGRERSSHRFDQRLAHTSLGFAQQPLDLREGLLDWVEVRRVGWQVDELAARSLDDLAHPAGTGPLS